MKIINLKSKIVNRKSQIVNHKSKMILSILFIVSILQTTTVLAQRLPEYSIYGGGGLSTLNYKLSPGKRSGGFGGDFGAGFTYFIDSNWGIHSGLGVGLYSAKAKLDCETITPNLIDEEGKRFDMHTTLAGYSETQKAMFLNIPVMAQYRLNPNEGFYAMGGFKVGIPINGKYSSKAAQLTNKGYYPDLNNYATVQRFAGYGIFEGKDFDDKTKLGVSIMLALEAGWKWQINNQFSLYSGSYFDFGLNNVVKDKNLPLINYSADDPSGFFTNSALSTFTKKASIMAVGIKLRLAYIK